MILQGPVRRILLAGYTGEKRNIGCRLTTEGLLSRFRREGAGMDTLSADYAFASLEKLKPFLRIKKSAITGSNRAFWRKIQANVPEWLRLKIRMLKKRRRFEQLEYLTYRFNFGLFHSRALIARRNLRFHIRFSDWQRWLAEFEAGEPEVMNKIEAASHVVINGEGTIHNNQPAGLALLAVAWVAQKKNKRVYLVNSTVESMNGAVLRAALSGADVIQSREPFTTRYLQKVGLRCEEGCDYAFYADADNAVSEPAAEDPSLPEKACLVTAGAEYLHSRPKSIQRICDRIRRARYTPYYLSLTGSDKRIVERYLPPGTPVISAEDGDWRRVMRLIRRSDLVVSGRHHVNIMALLARKPFIPLSSNTWKIEGTCRMFRWPIPVLPNSVRLYTALESIRRRDSDISRAFDLAAELQSVARHQRA